MSINLSPQLLIAAGLGVVVGISSALALVALRRSAKKAKYQFKETAPKTYSVVLTPKMISTISLRWFGPKFSPKDVPRFYDAASITEKPDSFRLVIDILVSRYGPGGDLSQPRPTKVLGFDARGFIFGAGLALELGLPLVLLRKDRKSPGPLVESGAFTKEYVETKEEKMSLRVGSIVPGDRVILVDDLIATGGTALSGFELVSALGGTVHEFAAVTELPTLNGVERIRAAEGGKYRDVPILNILLDSDLGPESCWDPVGWKEQGRVVPKEVAKSVQGASVL